MGKINRQVYEFTAAAGDYVYSGNRSVVNGRLVHIHIGHAGTLNANTRVAIQDKRGEVLASFSAKSNTDKVSGVGFYPLHKGDDSSTLQKETPNAQFTSPVAYGELEISIRNGKAVYWNIACDFEV